MPAEGPVSSRRAGTPASPELEIRMERIGNDLKFALRMMKKEPSFTAVVILTLAIGIGANTAIFSVVNAILVQPLPYLEPGRLVAVRGQSETNSSYHDFLDYRTQTKTLSHIAAYVLTRATLTSETEPEVLSGVAATSDLFPMLGVTPLYGREFSAEEDREGSPPAVVLSYSLWQRRFSSDPHMIGKTILLSGKSATVTGIMPRGFNFPVRTEQTDIWIPLGPRLHALPGALDRASRFLKVVARVKPGAPFEQAEVELRTITKRLEQQYPDTNHDVVLKLIPLRDAVVADVRLGLLVLLGAVGFVLLIVCANIANLFLARAATRNAELAIRTALGATRTQLFRQLLTESILLSIIGGTAGLLLASWSTEVLLSVIPIDIPRVNEISTNAAVLGFTMLIAIATGILFGLLPALQAGKSEVQEGLKQSGKGANEGRHQGRIRNILVASQIALSLVLLAGAGLFIKSFVRLLEVNPGFDPQNVVTAEVALPRAKYREPAQHLAIFQEVTQELSAVPGIVSVGGIDLLPLSGNNRESSFVIVGDPPPIRGESPYGSHIYITSDYFRAMGIPLKRGRFFSDRDSANMPWVVIINEELARAYFAGRDPLGRKIDLGDGFQREIVGIVGGVRTQTMDSPAVPEFYLPYRQEPQPYMTFVIRTSGPETAFAISSLRGIVRRIDQDLPLTDAATLHQWMAKSMERRRFHMMLLSVFAMIALVLAAIGIFGVISYATTRRTREIGIRMALGAHRRDVLRLVLRQGLLLALGGLAAGLLASLGLAPALSSLLYGVKPADPLTLAFVSLLLMFVALLATYIPARRAAGVEPVSALRYE